MRSLKQLIRDNLLASAAAATVGIAALAWLAFGFFGIHTAFIDDKVDEAGPVFASGAGASGLASDEISDADAAAMTEAMQGTDDASIDDGMPDMPEIITLASGSFIDRSHPTAGAVSVLTDGSEQRFLRFEDLQSDNGPDLNVYLVNSDAMADAGTFDDDFVDLGDLKGNIGSQNYEIPPDVDLSVYDTVVIWCVRFGVAFGAADLA